jgi:serine protease Do
MTSARIAAAEPSKGPANQLARLGLRVQTLTPEVARQFGIEEDKGVVITGVESGGLAAESGVQPGDLIVEADRKPVANVAQLQFILSRSKDRVLLLVKRKSGSMYLVFRLG